MMVPKLFALCRKPVYFQIILRDLLRWGHEIGPDTDHLRATIEWLCRAQDVTGCGGVSGGYHYHDGWQPPYPETTGYIIPTFLQYASLNGDRSYIERAVRMGNWETEIQLPSGAVRGGMGINGYPIVFNTGQVILGWTSLYSQTKADRFLNAAIRAADWLVSIQDPDGKWSKHTLRSLPHIYHTRVAWPLLEVYRLTDDETYKNAAEKQLLWALTYANKNGSFRQTNSTSNRTSITNAILSVPPITHAIAYTLRGLLESSFYLEEETKQKILNIVQRASENIMMEYQSRKKKPNSMSMYLPATLNENWSSKDNYSCLTGNAQIAIIWLKLSHLNGDARFLNSARTLIDQVKATQSLNSKNWGIRGGIAGSYPIWGKYLPFTYPNWAAKFFADAIMLQESITQKLEGKQTEL